MSLISTPINIDPAQVLGSIGYADESQPSARIVSLLDDYMGNYQDLIAQNYSYVVRDIKGFEGNRVFIQNDITLESKVIARLLQKCRKAVIFILTIGDFLEKQVASLAENGVVLQATVLDAIGSSTVEEFAAAFENEISGLARSEGMVISRRFSPGYCDWDVKQQRMLFRALGSDTAGVELKKSCLMIPQKSVSGIIGMGCESDGIAAYNPCNTCCKEDCPGRRE
ncbi:MAG TPA: vitamin B12 dependent-methionine synthase activation domain-containing protein [Dehalococcoidia bacterium]|nr:vitamin B12 dependent-methionine synthase activation domain-containing protein [Dehalococcoidia bacterium]